jgi:hypothetical protein
MKLMSLFSFFQTDLAHHNPFTIALKNLGTKISDKETGIFCLKIFLTLFQVYCLYYILKYSTYLLF